MAAQLFRGLKTMSLSCMAPAAQEQTAVDRQDPNGGRGYRIRAGSRGPLGSTRYLLETDEPGLSLSPPPQSSSSCSPLKKEDEETGAKIGEKVLSSAEYRDERVVVLKASLHCKGCERKLRKHLSRLEGVKSFKIEFEAKRVTVVGNITPLALMSSISKIKKVEFWPPT
ncbi:protein SODIUM POTASSIUM ROOT DEFECTIVE 2-like [Wolffia australiana]